MNTKIKKFNEMYGPDGEEDRDSWPNAPKLDNLMGAQHGMQKVRDIYEAELQRLRAQVEAMRVAGSAMEGLVMSAQSFLAKHLPPDGTSEKETISELLGLLDGPHQRNVQKAWTASLNPTPTTEPK